MSEVNRPSASEQAQADQIKSLEKQVKYQNKQLSQSAIQQGQQGLRPQNKGPEKKQMKSAFDKVLDDLNQPSSFVAPSAQESGKDSRLREVRRDEDRESHSRDHDEKDAKPQRSSKEESDTKPSGGLLKDRVKGKQTMKSQSEASSDQQQGDSGKPSEEAVSTQKKSSASNSAQETISAPPPTFLSRLQQLELNSAVAAQVKTLPKAVLDQIIQSVTIRRDKKDLGDVLELDFKDSFFQGLKLKVRARDKEIHVEFICPNSQVLATFKQERERIAVALGEKGVALRSIEISLK